MSRIIVALTVLMAGCGAFAGDAAVPVGDKEACMQGPLAQFGRYIGNWDIEDSQLSPDGKSWAPANADKWNFVCIGNGTAIQDFWLPQGGNVGTNLRTWNPETESWDIAWAANGLPGFAHITARQDENGNIVMHYVSPIPDPLRRITFYEPDDAGWNWTLELSTDGGETWFEVYRIRATRSD